MQLENMCRHWNTTPHPLLTWTCILSYIQTWSEMWHWHFQRWRFKSWRPWREWN